MLLSSKRAEAVLSWFKRSQASRACARPKEAWRSQNEPWDADSWIRLSRNTKRKQALSCPS
jgi:hypothetical protein